VMVTRIMLSLKKAADSQGDQHSHGEPTFSAVRFAGAQDHGTTGDGIALETLRSKGR